MFILNDTHEFESDLESDLESGDIFFDVEDFIAKQGILDGFYGKPQLYSDNFTYLLSYDFGMEIKNDK